MMLKPYVAALVVLSLALSGCTGSSEPGGLLDTTDGTAATNDPSSPTNPGVDPSQGPGSPPSRPTSNIKVDPNATFEGGAHKHDLWGGETQVVIMDKTLKTGPGNVCAGYFTVVACNQGETLIRFDPPTGSGRPNIVFPGTGKMEIRLSMAAVHHPFDLGISFPDRPSATQNRLKVDQAQKTFVIDEINETRTDPPHFQTSGWSFMLLTSQGSAPHPASLYQGPLQMTVTIFRDLTRELPVDPPHPDLWGGTTQMTLYSARLTADRSITPAASTTGGGNQIPSLPENQTVFPGTTRMSVTMAWTNSNPDVSKLRLRVCPANGNCGYTNSITMEPAVTSESATRRTFEFDVRPEWWDSPYSTKSRWNFDWRFEDPAGTHYGTIKGTIDWTIEIRKGN